MLGQVAALRGPRDRRSSELHHEIADGRRRLDRTVRAADGEEAETPARSGRRSPSSAWPPSCPGRRTWRRSGGTRSGASTRSPRSRPIAGTGGSTTTPTRRPPTRSSRSGAGSSPTSRSTRCATACRRRACRRSSPRSCWPSRWCGAALDDAGYARAAVPARADGRRPGHGRRRGAARDGLRLPLVPADARHGHRPAAGSAAMEACQGSCPSGPRTRSPASCSTSPPGRIANRLDLGGANYTVDAACGSSLAAAALAVRELETGRGRHGGPGRRRHGPEPVHLPGLQQDPGVLAAGPLPPVRRRGRRDRDQRGSGRGGPQAAGRRRARRRPDLRRDQGRGRLQRRPRRGPDRAERRGAGPGPRAGLRQGRASPGDGRLRRGARHGHGGGRRRRDRGADPGLPRRRAPARDVRGRLGQVADRPHQVRGGAGRPDQRVAGPLSQGPAADDRHRDAEPEARPRATARSASAPRPAPWLHADDDRPSARAGVSAFGFGGTNFHAVLEAYERDPSRSAGVVDPRLAGRAPRLAGERPPGPARAVERLAEQLAEGARVPLCGPGPRPGGSSFDATTSGPTLAIVADLARRPVREAGDRPAMPSRPARPSSTTRAGSTTRNGRPSAGSRWRSCSRARVRSRAGCWASWPSSSPRSATPFEEFDARSRPAAGSRIGPLVFPPPAFDDERDATRPGRCQATDVAQPAIGAACVGLLAAARATRA